MKSMRIAGIVMCLTAAFCLPVAKVPTTGQSGGTPNVAQKDTSADASCVFRKIEPTLQRKSHIPLRLPTYLPAIDCRSDLYAILGSADSAGYGILLGFDPDCEGQNVCLYGSVRASVSPIKLEGKSVPVKLRRGLSGRFFDSVCYAYCNESYIAWSESGFYYAIGIKAGKREELIRAANSAIDAGHKASQAP